MKIVMIGAGYVGLVSGTCFSDFGHSVICVEKDQNKLSTLQRGEVPIYEPGLEAMLGANLASGQIGFTSDLGTAVKGADTVFIAVGTPARHGDGHADLSYVFATAEELAPLLEPGTTVVIKSTVPVGTNRKVAGIIRDANPAADFSMVSNPEFLREGSAIGDFMRPDRVVVGVEDARAEQVMRQVYRPLNLRETPILFTDLETEEITKYAANAFLATKITFINEIADLCERLGGDVQEVAKGMGLDKRIGSKFLHAGPGYGGSCFPKDTLALAKTAREAEVPLSIVDSVIAANAARRDGMAARITEACGGVAGKRIAVFGVTFKPNTDDMREAPSLSILPALQAAGAQVVVCDPQGEREGAVLLPGCDWVGDPYDAASGADALVVLTEWNLFRGLDLGRVAQAMRGDVLVDLRNVYTGEEAGAAGLRYFPVGKRPVAKRRT